MKESFVSFFEQVMNRFMINRMHYAEEEKRRSKLIWISSLITSVFCFFYTLISIIIEFKEGYLSQGLTFFLFISILFLYKYTRFSNDVLANLFLFFGFQSIAILPYFSGGIAQHSFIIPWLSVVPVTASLVAKLKHAIIWYFICCLTLLYYLIFTKSTLSITYNLKYDSVFSVFCIIGLMLIMFLVNYTFKINEMKALSKIEKANQENIEKSRLLEEAYTKLEEANKRVIDSIYYAKGVQRSILPSKLKRSEIALESFCFHKAKDVLSGDFYWVEKKGECIFFAVVDNHENGVAGAFKGLAIQNVLHESLRLGLKSTDEIMENINSFFDGTTNNGSNYKDSTDLTVCCWNENNSTLTYSSTNNSIFHIAQTRQSNFYNTKRQAAIKTNSVEIKPINYISHQLKIEEPTMLYLFTDGFQKQLGGFTGQEYTLERLSELFKKYWDQPINKQNKAFSNHFKQWQGNFELSDDVLLFGVGLEPQQAHKKT